LNLHQQEAAQPSLAWDKWFHLFQSKPSFSEQLDGAAALAGLNWVTVAILPVSPKDLEQQLPQRWSPWQTSNISLLSQEKERL
jgi:hypothetical protein